MSSLISVVQIMLQFISVLCSIIQQFTFCIFSHVWCIHKYVCWLLIFNLNFQTIFQFYFNAKFSSCVLFILIRRLCFTTVRFFILNLLPSFNYLYLEIIVSSTYKIMSSSSLYIFFLNKHWSAIFFLIHSSYWYFKVFITTFAYCLCRYMSF